MSDGDKQDFGALVSTLVTSVKRIELALTGDSAMGHWGLVRRVDNITVRVRWIERIVYTCIGVGLATGAFYAMSRDWLPHFLK